MSNNPANIGEEIRKMGARLNPPIIQKRNMLYAPLLAKAPKDGVHVTKDEKYGPHERHRLDVFEPGKKTAGPVPILVFLHGDGFVRGDKARVANIGTYFARKGILTITMNYRFAPEIKWPEGGKDIAPAIESLPGSGLDIGHLIYSLYVQCGFFKKAHAKT